MASAELAGVSGAARPLMKLITMSGIPILQQLHLEEQLLRCTADNWCVINDGTAPPTIVMGVSGYKLNSSCTSSGRMIQACIGLPVDHVELLIHFFVTTGESQIQAVLRDQVPVVRRFSGGGTVIGNDICDLHLQQE
ncbi:unnamed protein product [Miscanthus lutarioriparius]|uniref:Uncharacterized protein n=1 Tax=Miscanthus lutarioriparius TaxID=422564 RepID=A0A811N9C9_9POAL|nr:unnamed protein product [Miscanthus lutarioriparius]